MKIILLIQARMGSTRLPGKVMKLVNGKPMISLLLERVSNVKNISKVIVTTSEQPENDILVDYVKEVGGDFFRGSENDVLDRFYRAAKVFKGDMIVRITADCPLLDPQLIDDIIDFALKNKKDYCSNVIPPTFPDGQDVEVFTFASLEKCWKEATLKSDREHVTTYIRKNASHNNKDLFSSINYTYTKNISHIRMTVDEPDDLDCISNLVRVLGRDAQWTLYTDYIINHQDEFKNQSIKRGVGYLKSLQQDLK